MINSHGFWQTVNTAGDAVLSTGTICMRHATYLTYTLFGHFNRFIRHEKGTYLSQPDAAVDCRTQDADLVRLYGQKGKAVLAYFMNNGLHGVEGWFAGTQVTIGQALVSFPDGKHRHTSYMVCNSLWHSICKNVSGQQQMWYMIPYFSLGRCCGG
jgi:hypothetical protein